MDDVDEALLVVGDAAGLVEGGGDGFGAEGELVELDHVVVVEDDVEAEDALLDVLRHLQDGGEAVVGEAEHRDGAAAVDVLGEVGAAEELVELLEPRVSAEEDGDVEG